LGEGWGLRCRERGMEGVWLAEGCREMVGILVGGGSVGDEGGSEGEDVGNPVIMDAMTTPCSAIRSAD